MKRLLIAGTLLSLLIWGCANPVNVEPIESESSPTVTRAVSELPENAALRAVIAVQEDHTPRIMQIPGVVGTGVSMDERGRHVIAVFTEREGIRNIPLFLDDVAVKLKVTGKIEALARKTVKLGRPDKPDKVLKKPAPADLDPASYFERPVPIGVSTGHSAVIDGYIFVGTIGCRVSKGNEHYLLSNYHVLAEGLDRIDPDVTYDKEDNPTAFLIPPIDDDGVAYPILQPGLPDYTGTPSIAECQIGTVADYKELLFDGSDNTVDAAIAVTTTDLGNATPSDGYGTPKSETIAAAVRMSVQKYGRTTGLTKGRVYALNAIVNVGYDGGVARFVNQIIITPGTFSAGGDSGSLIVDRNRRPVGLLFAGSPQVTIANPIGDVLDAFGVTIDGE